ncbi:MAG: hypothetical protein OHK0056_25980 [Bacteriovoracaceae bacterium]
MKQIIWSLLMTALFMSSLQARELKEIKTEILKLAESYKGQMDLDGTKQAALEELVDELLAEVPPLTMAEKAQRAFGVWNQVWGPYAFDDSDRMPPGIDVDKIYQYISKDGYYYNFAEYKLLGVRLKTFLRGNYSLSDDRVQVQFNRTGLIRERGAISYLTAGEMIEQGKIKVFNFPENLPPAGVKGVLVEVYADDEMRINYGVVGEDLSSQAIFVMKRVK